jgi:hypothetical protein
MDVCCLMYINKKNSRTNEHSAWKPLTFVSSKDRSSDSSAVGMDFVEVISYMLPVAIGQILKNLKKLPGVGGVAFSL